MGDAGAASPAYDSVVAARFLLSAAAAGGADARQLARDAQLPSWTFTAEQAIIPAPTISRPVALLCEPASTAGGPPASGRGRPRHQRHRPRGKLTLVTRSW